jgi:drug/metabolite transporter (DMT)-like permease
MTWFALATCSAVLSAAAALIQKKILFRLSALEFSFLVSAVILVFSLFVPFTADVLSVPATTLLILIGKSVLGGMAFLCVMMALQRNQISSALPLLGITPGAAALLSVLLLGESLRPWEWAGMGLMMAGTYALEVRPHQKLLQPLRNIVATKNYYYIYAAVALFAISSVADRMLLSGYKVPPAVVLFYQHIVYCTIFGLQLFFRKHSFATVLEKGKASFPLILTVALITIAYRFTQLEATKLAPVALVLAVKRTSILYATLVGGILYSDERISVKVIAGILIVASGFIILREIG